jgi:hypothetical protein
MNIKELNEALSEFFEPDDYFTSDELYSIAIDIRNGDSEGVENDKGWYMTAEVIGDEGNDGYVHSLCQCLRDETLKGIAARVEVGEVEDFVELSYKPNNITEKLSIEATAKEFPDLVKVDEDGECFWSVRFIIGTYNAD